MKEEKEREKETKAKARRKPSASTLRHRVRVRELVSRRVSKFLGRDEATDSPGDRYVMSRYGRGSSTVEGTSYRVR